jgi:hypothetical protein
MSMRAAFSQWGQAKVTFMRMRCVSRAVGMGFQG